MLSPSNRSGAPARIACGLLVAAVALGRPALACAGGDPDTEASETNTAEAAPCPASSTGDTATSGPPCTPVPPPAGPSEESKGFLSMMISENLGSTGLLRQLLLGRQFQYFGQVGADFAVYDIPSFTDQSGGEIRRFRVGLVGVNPWFRSVSYKVEVDLTDRDYTVSDAFFDVDLGDRGSLTVGNQSGTISLSNSSASLSLLFMEQSLVVSAFDLDKRIGVAYQRYSPQGGFRALVFGRDLNTDAKHPGVSLRAYFNPRSPGADLWHVGVNYTYADIGQTTSLSTPPESHVTDIMLVDTGDYEDVDSAVRYGLEFAWARGPMTYRAEAMLNEWRRSGSPDNRFVGAYLEGSYSLTHQHFGYSQGHFQRPRPKPGHSAWELGYRLSWLSLNDGDVRGGEEFNIGLALNYYPTDSLRGQLNLIHVESDQPDSDGLIVQGRLQFNW